MAKKTKQYYNIEMKDGKLQFHTGPDQQAVRECRSLNHRIDIDGVASGERIATLVEGWMKDVAVFKLTLAKNY